MGEMVNWNVLSIKAVDWVGVIGFEGRVFEPG
jgi:hypothetical protein